MMHAVYDLQSRIFNILKRDFLTAYYTNGTDREKFYAQQNTVFLVAQFLGWTELIRQEIQFLDLGFNDHTPTPATPRRDVYKSSNRQIWSWVPAFCWRTARRRRIVRHFGGVVRPLLGSIVTKPVSPAENPLSAPENKLRFRKPDNGKRFAVFADDAWKANEAAVVLYTDKPFMIAVW